MAKGPESLETFSRSPAMIWGCSPIAHVLDFSFYFHFAFVIRCRVWKVTKAPTCPPPALIIQRPVYCTAFRFLAQEASKPRLVMGVCCVKKRAFLIFTVDIFAASNGWSATPPASLQQDMPSTYWSGFTEPHITFRKEEVIEHHWSRRLMKTAYLVGNWYVAMLQLFSGSISYINYLILCCTVPVLVRREENEGCSCLVRWVFPLTGFWVYFYFLLKRNMRITSAKNYFWLEKAVKVQWHTRSRTDRESVNLTTPCCEDRQKEFLSTVINHSEGAPALM